MDDATLEIVFFAVLAAFICHRLWSVLGRRDGETPPAQPEPFTIRDATARIQLNRQPPVSLPPPQAVFNPDEPISLDGILKQIKIVDPSFAERGFLDGAKAAFRMIVAAFADGNRDALKPLLGDDVYHTFDRAISDRAANRTTLQTTILSVDSSIDTARLTASVARITVSFRSSQANIVRSAEGSIVDGDQKRPDEMVDIWTFARDLRSRDPNWTLVETRHLTA